MFHVLKGVYLNKTRTKNLPDNGAQVGGWGRGQGRFSQKPQIWHFFFEAFPKETMIVKEGDLKEEQTIMEEPTADQKEELEDRPKPLAQKKTE